MTRPLISGRFTADEARALLTALTRVKTSFHAEKIRTVHREEEDIKHSERRIGALENSLRDALSAIQASGAERVDLLASVEVRPVLS